MALVQYNSVFIPLCSPKTCKDVFNPNVTTFQSNCAEGLHFSAFHLLCKDVWSCTPQTIFFVSDPGVTGRVTKRREREIEETRLKSDREREIEEKAEMKRDSEREVEEKAEMKRDRERGVDEEAGMKRDRERELKMRKKRERTKEMARECSREKKIKIEGEMEEVGAREQGRMMEEWSGKQMEGGVGTAVESGKEYEKTKVLQGLHITQYVHNILFEDISYCGNLYWLIIYPTYIIKWKIESF